MIKSLRKRHLQVWKALTLLLPAAIIGAWLVIPQQVKDRLLQPPSTAALPVVLEKMDKGSYGVRLRGSSDGAFLQLEWISRTALTTPSAIIYQVSSAAGGPSSAASSRLADPTEGAEIIGRIGERGTYHFPLKKDPEGGDAAGRSAVGGDPAGKGPAGAGLHFLLYDIIHHQVIDSINF
jgi:hypothetical protein